MKLSENEIRFKLTPEWGARFILILEALNTIQWMVASAPTTIILLHNSESVRHLPNLSVLFGLLKTLFWQREANERLSVIKKSLGQEMDQQVAGSVFRFWMGAFESLMEWWVLNRSTWEEPIS